ncbi:histone acetyltransferase 1 [Spiromyces aspiralis]|uniref:Histone acetyltransferase 1 n=1 Tax=Spiromyces aspiralis TaxID=68401 RepID=A0ACC1HMP6_9FUNG|nr:histone acetyltransferase 1 [Spiromyces aspiralis]
MFDDLRDKNDMRYLVAQNVFAGLEAPVRRDTIDRIQEQHKMSRRQLIRCIEIGLLKSLDKTDKDKYRRYRLFVKRRLYSQNSDILASLPPHERKEKLEETYRNIEEDYHRILNML